ncbi:MAG: hypothetical protein KDA57_14795 [Planctomycetales bacterium]|nr:hypothetical protein [Planctomycetales bacterium]
MSKTKSEIDYPCFTGLYEDSPGQVVPFVTHQGTRCYCLFSTEQLVERWFHESLGKSFDPQLLRTVTLQDQDELIQYFQVKWHTLAVQGVTHLVVDLEENSPTSELSISLVLWGCSEVWETYRPHHDWSKLAEKDWEFRPLLPAESIFDLGAFLLRPDGSMWMSEGREIGEHSHGELYLTDDDDPRFLEMMSPPTKVLAAGGDVVIRNKGLRLHFVFEPRDGSQWEYKYDMAQGTWYERKLVGRESQGKRK